MSKGTREPAPKTCGNCYRIRGSRSGWYCALAAIMWEGPPSAVWPSDPAEFCLSYLVADDAADD